MKISRYAIVCLSSISLNSWAAPIESTDNYAFGAALIQTDPESMFSRVELDERVYTQTTSPTLDDVRVFNRNGQTVPFTLIDVYDKQPTSQLLPLVIYPLTQANLVSNTNNKQSYTLAVAGQNINVNIDRSNNNQYSYSYLLHLPATSKLMLPITELKLSFAEQPDSWQAVANIAYSSDLKYWQTAVSDEPIMKLVNRDQQQLSLTDIRFQPYTNYSSHNWLITLSATQPIPALTQVIAAANSASNHTLYPIDFSLRHADSQTAIYVLPTVMPIKELSVLLDRKGTVLPVTIYYQTQADDNTWQKLTDRIIRQATADDDPMRITLDGRLISAIKLVTINSAFTQAPKLTAYRNKVDLIFNSANNAPFILAWGTAHPQQAALPSSALLSASDSAQSLPLAFMGDAVKLAGDKALRDNQPSHSPFWANGIIWLALILGAGVLVLLAVKLFNEVNQQD